MNKCCFCNISFDEDIEEIQHLLDDHSTYCCGGHEGDCNKICLGDES